MKKLFALPFFVLLLAQANLAGAPLAQVIGLVPPVEASTDGKTFVEVKLWQHFDEGTEFRTGKGRLALRLKDKSIVRLRSNTSLTLTKFSEIGAKRDVVLSLISGFARFLVAKLDGGESFEVHTPNAVAAVKGTDFETGFDPDNNHTHVDVFSTDGQGVLLKDLKDVLEQVIRANEAGGLGPKGLEALGKIPLAERQKAEQEYQELLKESQQAHPDQGAGAGAGPDTHAMVVLEQLVKDTLKDPGNQTSTNGTQNFQDVINDALVDLGKSLNTEQNQNNQDQNNDGFTGLTYIDRSGYRVQTSHVVLRPDPATVEKVHTTTRHSGPLAGDSVLDEYLAYNQALPDDWQSVVGQPLDRPGNLDAARNFLIWPVQQGLLMSGPAEDSVKITTDFMQPAFWYDLYNGYPTATILQPYKTTYMVNAIPMGTEIMTLDSRNWGDTGELNGYWQSYKGYLTQGYSADGLTQGDNIYVTNAVNEDKSVTFSYIIDDNYNPMTMFSLTACLVDNNGKLLDMSAAFPGGFQYAANPYFTGAESTLLPLWGKYAGHLELYLDSDTFTLHPGIDLFFEEGSFQQTFPWITPAGYVGGYGGGHGGY